MASYNEHTGARLVSRASSKAYVSNYDAIFNPKAATSAEIELVLPTSQATSFQLSSLMSTMDVIESQIISEGADGTRTRLVGMMAKAPREQAVAVKMRVDPAINTRIDVLAEALAITSAQLPSYLANFYIVINA